MSIALNDVPEENAERLAQQALARVRQATETSAGRNVISLSIVGDANPIEIPSELSDVLMTALANLAAGHHVTVLPTDSELTTVQAAQVLNVSRPYLIKLLEEQRIEYRKVGTHRRVSTGSLLDYKARDDVGRRAAADSLVQLSEELGFDG